MLPPDRRASRMTDDPRELSIPDPPAAAGRGGVIDEDLYCLTCGYNLRGLSGDPVRCPECGESNDLGTVRIPAPMIGLALHNLETAPTMSVVGSIMMCGGALAIISGFLARQPCPAAFALIGCGGGMALLAWALDATRRACQEHPAWRRIVLDFHLITFLCAGVPVVLGCIAAAARLPLAVVPIPALISLVWGLRMYPPAVQRRHQLQRDTAVRVAAETLRRRFHRPRRT
ncbi:MAG: hypothetical protein C4547_00525 [Phycisphaerales bacterium]|nr:MAG: hypothetical protein C4547_00525 [Phycisphaerales bacterium]